MRDRRRKLNVARTLENLVSGSRALAGIRRHDLGWGQTILVRTRNSEYRLTPASDGTYFVTGGWFGRGGAALCKVGVNGCTFGGTAICSDLVAAPGLFLEFGNGVRTTRIQEVVHVTSTGMATRN
jgi:hypothetical protein